MPTLILSPRYTPDSNALWKAAIDAGWSVERLHTHRPPVDLRERDPVLYGEGLFAIAIAQELELALLQPPYRWLADLPSVYRLRDVTYTTLAEARNHPASAFIKPAGDKSFDASVYSSGADLPSDDAFPADMPVLIAEPVAWEIEFRCFVRHREVLALSPYSRYGDLVRTEEGLWPASDEEFGDALTFCTQLLSDTFIALPPGVVIDVGKIKDRGWAVVEVNPAWASGIYGCDPAKVLDVIACTCQKLESVTNEDRQWIFE